MSFENYVGWQLVPTVEQTSRALFATDRLQRGFKKKKVDNTQSVQVEEIQRLGQRLKYSLGSVSFAQAEPQNVRSSDGH